MDSVQDHDASSPVASERGTPTVGQSEEGASFQAPPPSLKRGPGRPRKQPSTSTSSSSSVSFAPTLSSTPAAMGYSFSQEEMQKFLMKQKIKKYAKKYVLKQQAKYQAPLYPAPRTPYPSEDEDTITADTYEDEEDDEEDDEEGEEGDDEQQTMNKENYAPTQRARPHLTRPPAYANPPRGSKLAQILGYR